MDYDDVVEQLHRSADVIKRQRENPDPQFLQRAKRAMHGTFKWLDTVERHTNRRTMPKTNGRGREGQASTTMIGYQHPDL